MTRGTTEAVKFQSMPSGATVTTTLGTSCTTPCEIEVKRKTTFNATIELNGKRINVPVKTQFSDGGAAGTIGNVLFGGVIGIGVDATSGANLDHYPNPVVIDFTQGAPRLLTAAPVAKEAEAE